MEQPVQINQTQSSPPGRTYLDVLSNGVTDEYVINPIYQNDRIKILVPKELTEKMVKYWENSLVGRFSGPRPGLDIIRNWIKNKWKTKNPVEVMAMPKGCVLFRFANQEDMIAILLKSPWMLGKKAITLEKWHPDFDPAVTMVKQTPIWVQMPGLLLQFWNLEVVNEKG